MGSGSSIEKQFIDDLIASNEILIFSKTNCSYCKLAKTALNKLNLKFHCVELDNNQNCPKEDCTQVIKELILQTRMKTVPQIFYKGNLIGGYTELANEISKGTFNK